MSLEEGVSGMKSLLCSWRKLNAWHLVYKDFVWWPGLLRYLSVAGQREIMSLWSQRQTVCERLLKQALNMTEIGTKDDIWAPQDKGSWQVHGVAKSWTWLKRLSTCVPSRSIFSWLLVSHGPPLGLSQWLSGKEPTCQCRRHKRCGFNPWAGKISCRRAWKPTSVFLPGESQGQRNLVD